MNKEEAIEIAKGYINKMNTTQPVSIDTREVLDKQPIEFEES